MIIIYKLINKQEDARLAAGLPPVKCNFIKTEKPLR